MVKIINVKVKKIGKDYQPICNNPRPEDILHANRLVLDDIDSDNLGRVINSKIKGQIQIRKNRW